MAYTSNRSDRNSSPHIADNTMFTVLKNGSKRTEKRKKQMSEQMVAESRLGTYALIYALERDLRDIINTNISRFQGNTSFLEEFEEKCIKRFLSDTSSKDYQPSDLVEYLDFLDASTLLCKSKQIISESLWNEIKRLMPQFEKISTIRNRVMHGRPMEFDDYYLVSKFAQDLPVSSDLEWKNTKNALKEINANPRILSKIDIPIPENDEKTIHNLPNPDFDETGFIGRKDEIADIRKRLKGNNKVVTLIGDGGIGKSALALKIAYDILDDEDNGFDVIVWVEAKKNILTESGVKIIRDSITPGEFITRIHSQYSNNTSANLIDETLNYLKEFKTLLILDNLETILSEEIRRFIREASLVSTILITSRIGLNELEYRREIDGLRPNEAIKLLRQYGQIRGIREIASVDNSVAKDMVQDLHHNPLAIRWFVYSVAAGKSPASLSQDKSQLLNFCLGNVFEHISPVERAVLEACLVYTGESISEAEIMYLVPEPHLIVQNAISRLLATTFLKRSFRKSASSSECIYSIPEFARQYLVGQKVVSNPRFLELTAKLSSLSKSIIHTSQTRQIDKYSISTIDSSTASENVAAKLLYECLSISKHSTQDPTINEKLLEAQRLAPGYIEVYKVSGFIKAESGDYLGAEEDYQTGLSISPDNEKLLYFYAGFLLIHLNDHKRALAYLTKLTSIDKDNYDASIMLCRCLISSGEFDEAISLLRPIALNRNIQNAKIRRITFSQIMSALFKRAKYEYLSLHDSSRAFRSLAEAMDYFHEAYERGDCDDKLMRIAERILNEFRIQASRSGNVENFDRWKIENKFYLSVVSEKRSFILKSNEYSSAGDSFDAENSQQIANTSSLISSVDVGSILTGIVTKIEEGQYLVKFSDSISGYIPMKSTAAKGFVKIMNYAVGDSITCSVRKKKAGSGGRLFLNLAHLPPTSCPWDTISEHHVVNSVDLATITSVVDYGAFANLESGFVCLIHKSEFSWYDQLANPNDYVKSGDSVKVKICAINIEEKRIDASIKRCLINEWSNVADIHPINSNAIGTAIRISKEIITIKLESSFIATARVNPSGRKLMKGESIKILVTGYGNKDKVIFAILIE